MQSLWLSPWAFTELKIIESALELDSRSSASRVPSPQWNDRNLLMAVTIRSKTVQLSLEPLLGSGSDFAEAHELLSREFAFAELTTQVLPLEDERREEDLAPFSLQVSERVAHRFIIMKIITKFVYGRRQVFQVCATEYSRPIVDDAARRLIIDKVRDQVAVIWVQVCGIDIDALSLCS